MGVLFVTVTVLFKRNWKMRTVKIGQILLYIIEALLVMNAIKYGGLGFRIISIALAVIDIASYMIFLITYLKGYVPYSTVEAAFEGFAKDETVEECMK